MNLATDPWLPVLNQHGKKTFISLNRLFSEDHLWKDISLYPHERVSVMRFLICLVQAAIQGPDDMDDFEDNAQEIKSTILTYLNNWKGAFSLFDSEKPFLQISRLEQVGKELNAVTKLNSTLSTGSNPTLFDHGAGSPEKEPSFRYMEDRDIAVSLLTFQNFSLGGLFPQVKWNGKQSGKSGVNDAPCASQSMLHAFVRRDTLVKTIFANTITKDDVIATYGKYGWGKPVWEWMPSDISDEAARHNATETYLGRLVPLSRWVKINDDRMTMLMGEGYKYPVAPIFHPEPTATQVVRKINNKEERLLLNIKAKAPFRELHAMTVRRKSDNGGPLTLNTIPENDAFDLLVAALEREQASEQDSVESVYHIPAPMNCDRGRAIYEKEIQFAESTASRLTHAIERYRKNLDPSWEEAIKKNRSLKQKLNNKAFALYWTRVEGELEILFRYVDSLGKDRQTVDELQSVWRKAVGRIARESYETLCGNANSRQLKAFIAGLNILFPKSLKKAGQHNEMEES